MIHLSIVSPVYRAEKIIPLLVERIEKAVSKITLNYEIILVEDCGPDNSWNEIEKIALINPKVKGIKLSRNFGQHNAITAGLTYANGEWIVVMDCDLQDQPEEIINLYNKAQEGYEIVFGRRHLRKDNFFKRNISRIFYLLFSYLTETKQDHTIANFGIFNKKVIKAILTMGDYFRVFPILIQWVGFNKTSIDIDHDYRKEGNSSYSFLKLLKMATDMIISFSEKPLKLGLKFGVLISGLSFAYGIYSLIKYFLGEIQVPGFTSLIIILLFATGLIITFIGLVGLYIGKIATQVKNRPNFVVHDQINIQ